eukprot:CAMPEP_0194357784 /NCGR_PEP_ID=MMETSP0174-20130528/5218_1 /TAXON_ID=216777 /ORGANISM="Proboscia alata, Strain PI-D3" /LENGTH=425 /DNA_ID=CAMNT_0039127953 /DNA_START=33 /DNA_END=1310 /DNA_ORIENTATION=-
MSHQMGHRYTQRQSGKNYNHTKSNDDYNHDEEYHQHYQKSKRSNVEYCSDDNAYDESDGHHNIYLNQSFESSHGYKDTSPVLESDHMTELSKSIMTNRWNDAVNVISTYPEQVRTWTITDNPDEPLERFLPLHLACARDDVPLSFIYALLIHFPNSVKSADAQGMLPLHYACSNNLPTDIISMILCAYPDAASMAEPIDKRLPLHQACFWGRRSATCSTMAVLNKLVFANPDCLLAKDRNGHTPLDLLELNMDELEQDNEEENTEDEDWYESLKEFLEQSILAVRLKKLVTGDAPAEEEHDYAASSSFEDENNKASPSSPCSPQSRNDKIASQIMVCPAREPNLSRYRGNNSLSSISRSPKSKSAKEAAVIQPRPSRHRKNSLASINRSSSRGTRPSPDNSEETDVKYENKQRLGVNSRYELLLD